MSQAKLFSLFNWLISQRLSLSDFQIDLCFRDCVAVEDFMELSCLSLCMSYGCSLAVLCFLSLHFYDCCCHHFHLYLYVGVHFWNCIDQLSTHYIYFPLVNNIEFVFETYLLFSYSLLIFPLSFICAFYAKVKYYKLVTFRMRSQKMQG